MVSLGAAWGRIGEMNNSKLNTVEIVVAVLISIMILIILQDIGVLQVLK